MGRKTENEEKIFPRPLSDAILIPLLPSWSTQEEGGEIPDLFASKKEKDL